MTKKLTRHGNSLALIIDKPLLEVLKISEKTELELSIEDGALVIKPAKKKKNYSDRDIKKIAQEFIEKYEDLFKKLAK